MTATDNDLKGLVKPNVITNVSTTGSVPELAVPRTARRKAGRPRTAILTQPAICETAIALIDRQGFDALTMSSLAQKLNVAPSALYNHVHNKEHLFRLIQDELMRKVDTEVFATLPLDQALMKWAHSYRSVFAAHAPLIPLIAVLPIDQAPATVQMYETVARSLEQNGWDPTKIVPTIVALESFIFGSAFDANAPENIFQLEEQGSLAPHFSKAVQAQQSAGVDPALLAFTLGLSALIDGLTSQAKSL